MTETLYRASFEIGERVGRTLSGLAVPYDRPTLVRDIRGGPFPGRPYREAFAAGSGDVSMRQHPKGFPVFVRHDYTQDPLGNVLFRRSAEGTIFQAVLSNTPDADAKLELVNDGAMNSVSVGFRPHQHVLRATVDGDLVYRTEVAYRELSLAPTGFGQYEDALVTSVRSEQADTPILDALKRRRARLHNLT